jgi:hypothetical protein
MAYFNDPVSTFTSASLYVRILFCITVKVVVLIKFGFEEYS